MLRYKIHALLLSSTEVRPGLEDSCWLAPLATLVQFLHVRTNILEQTSTGSAKHGH